MSRELKYRVYSRQYKKYLDTSGEGTFGEVHHLALRPDGKLYYADISIEYPGTLSECPVLEWEEGYEDCVVEQFTGLLDQNGKELYEGDVVRYHSDILLGHAICVVTFYNCKWVLSQHNAPIWAISEGDSENIEVIGNIHQNKELLGDT